jgi:3-hydroxybutyryl-CoA dehydratase
MTGPIKTAVGDRPEPRVVGPITVTDIVRFAGAGGDFNPIHHDAARATAAGFEAPIAMGQMTAGMLSAWLTDWCGVENLTRYEVRFTAPMAVGDTVELRGEVVAVRGLQDGLGLADLELAAMCSDTVIVSGRATIVITI